MLSLRPTRMHVVVGVVFSFALTAAAYGEIPARNFNGLVHPTGAPTNPLPCGTWLQRDAANGGCYDPGFYHIGVDIPTPDGALRPVYAMADGQVVSVSVNGWGTNNVGLLIRHRLSSGADFIALYGHVRTWVGVGSLVTAGAQIGNVGLLDGQDHLHLGVHPGSAIPLDPWGREPNWKWADTNGFVDPLWWIATQVPWMDADVRARQDMRDRARTNQKFTWVLAPPASNDTFGSNLNWDPAWELRWMGFVFSGQSGSWWVNIFQATSKTNPSIRYTSYTDPDTGQWTGWLANP